MFRSVSNTTSVMPAASVPFTGTKTRPTMGALAALTGPTLATTLVSNVQKTPALAMNATDGERTETSKERKEKKDGSSKLTSRFSGWRSTEKSLPLDSLEALTVGMSQLAVHGDRGEMSKRHRRQISEPSMKRVDFIDSGIPEDDNNNGLRRPSSAHGHEFIHSLTTPRGRGVQSKTRAQMTFNPFEFPTDEEIEGRGSNSVRISAYHPSDSRPDDADMASFKRRLDNLPEFLQRVVLNHGGNTHGDMLQVMSHIEARHSETAPLLRVVYEDEGDYKPRLDGTPPTPRQNRGVKAVFCSICDKDCKNIGDAAGHLTEAHWELKPWRCMTCYERFSHADMRMKNHIQACAFAGSSSRGMAHAGRGQPSRAFDTIPNEDGDGGVTIVFRPPRFHQKLLYSRTILGM